jgi:hypothetical protein
MNIFWKLMFDWLDIDECEDPNACHQHCLNTNGSFICACDQGFVLQTDRRSCKIISKFRINGYLIRFFKLVRERKKRAWFWLCTVFYHLITIEIQGIIEMFFTQPEPWKILLSQKYILYLDLAIWMCLTMRIKSINHFKYFLSVYILKKLSERRMTSDTKLAWR